MPLEHHKNILLSLRDFGLGYPDADAPLFEKLSFEIAQGERVFLNGANGCGKSSLIRAVRNRVSGEPVSGYNMNENGTLQTASGLVVSYISQDTSFLQGSIGTFCEEQGLDESLFCAILRQLDFERVQFVKHIEDYSEGQKKKVLIAASLLTPAHLYIWDEPLNYIDVFSRMQIEKLLLSHPLTMLIVEHDVRFREQIATKIIEM